MNMVFGFGGKGGKVSTSQKVTLGTSRCRLPIFVAVDGEGGGEGRL